MLLERIYDQDLAQASYIIGCQAQGTALVIDPRRDIQVYRDIAAAHGMTITAVTETHIHADFLSGTRELAAATGARIYVSGEGGEDWSYGFDATLLRDGDTITLGNLTIEAKHTPGHTPEHLSFLVTDGAFSSEPGYYFTGDFVFNGDLGRPDLLDEAAGFENTRFEGAQQLFASLKKAFIDLPDFVQVYPGHGAGSACGKALGALPSSTVGYEKRFSWWAPYLQNDDEQGFIDELLDGQPDAHAYFARMKRQNKQGPAVIGEVRQLAELDADALRERLDSQSGVLLDTRSVSELQAGSVPDQLALPHAGKAASHGGWAYDPEAESTPLTILAPDAESAAEIRDHLVRVGVDTADSYITSLEGLPTRQLPTISPQDLEQAIADGRVTGGPDAENAQGSEGYLLDVRNRTEHAQGTIPGAAQLSAGKVLWHQDELPQGTTLYTFCQSGVRNAVAAAALRRAGFDVVEIEGSYSGWVNR